MSFGLSLNGVTQATMKVYFDSFLSSASNTGLNNLLASWDSPPGPHEEGYEAYSDAFQRFVYSRTVEVPKLKAAHAKHFDDRAKDVFMKKHYLKDAADLQLGQAAGLKLMPFQVDGFNWLCSNWWNHQQCILADEMGLVRIPYCIIQQ